MTNNLSILQKGLILVLIPFVCQALFLGVLAKIRIDQSDAQQWAAHTHRVLADADHLSALLSESQNSLRGFLITANPSYSLHYVESRDAVRAQLKKLEAAVADNPEQTQRVGEIDRRSAALYAWFDALHALISHGERAQAVEKVKGLNSQDPARDTRATLDEFLRAEERLDAMRQAALRRQAQIQNLVLIGGAVLALFSTALLGIVFARSIAGRLRALAENSRRVADGRDMLPPLTGDDELGRLDKVFRTMTQSLAEKNRENETFVYSVSHDLRSPLVNLQGFSQELATSCRDLRQLVTHNALPENVQKEALALLDRNMAESVHFIQNAVTRLSAIIDALLRLSRAGRVEYRMQEVDANAAVQRITEALRGTLDQKRAEIAVHDLPPAWGDPTAVELIFANLIGNAVNYLDPSRPGRIEVGALEPDDGKPAVAPTYFVRDNGLGITPAQQAKLFVAFQRLHPDAAPGEGIGLALVRRIVDRHGGRIWLESQPGEGTTFYFQLPPNPQRNGTPRVAQAAAVGE